MLGFHTTYFYTVARENVAIVSQGNYTILKIITSFFPLEKMCICAGENNSIYLIPCYKYGYNWKYVYILPYLGL